MPYTLSPSLFEAFQYRPPRGHSSEPLGSRALLQELIQRSGDLASIYFKDLNIII